MAHSNPDADEGEERVAAITPDNNGASETIEHKDDSLFVRVSIADQNLQV